MSKRLKFTTNFILLTVLLSILCLGFCFSQDVAATIKTANSSALEQTSYTNETAIRGIEDYFLPEFSFESQSTSTAIKTVNVGGFPVGINLKTDGLIILSKCKVVTSKGVIEPAQSIDIKSGDVLVAVDDLPIKCKEDVEKALGQSQDEVVLTIRRGNSTNRYTVTPVVDSVNGKKRIGLVLQDGILGIGTMTFIDGNSGRYACLGHPIKDSENNDVICGGGNIYTADVSGVKKGQKGKAGELSGIFDYTITPIGTVTKNNTFGLYGQYQQKVSTGAIQVAHRDSVKAGKAQILTTISGSKPRLYDVEIIKVNKQSQPSDKSMVIRIVDEQLLKVTGGIVQGMSGSPIIQNNMLVGAVTHVFINDPTKGYGLFAQWMIEECNK
ncbi:MAG: SpoIVB peptidase [Eubacteriales bacterium]|nr:SpoIVB peptidase [Eubacteriales bacterium]